VLALPTDKPRPSAQTFQGATEYFTLPKSLLRDLRALGLKEQATLFMLLEAAFAALLHRYSGQADILVGTPISGRTQSETGRLVGCFLNTVVLRSQLTAGQSFRAQLQQARARALGCVRPCGTSFRTPGRHRSSRPRSEPHAPVPSYVRSARPRRKLAVSNGFGHQELPNRHIEVRSVAICSRDRARPRWPDGVQHRPVRGGYHLAPVSTFWSSARGNCPRSRPEHLRTAHSSPRPIADKSWWSGTALRPTIRARQRWPSWSKRR